MRIGLDYPLIEVDDFARRFTQRAGNLMWLLGAGASAAAGIPTASDMIWEFKQQLYISQRRISPKSVADLSNPAVRSTLQSYIDSAGHFPSSGDPDEYAALFEAVWPNEMDRRSYIDAKITGAKPSYGHLALATLMRDGLTKLVWTTNFDPLIADACAKVFDGTGALTTIALDAPDLASEAINAERWPIEIKLHGDFRSRRLKNTSDELRQQDARLRHILIDESQRRGLIVIGFSGRDASVMEALEEAINGGSPFPNGLFWLYRGEDAPLPQVRALMQLAASKKIDGGLVHIENFDESLRDIVRLVEVLDKSVLEQFAQERRWWTPASSSSGSKGFPVIRLNALPVEIIPTVCRRVVCTVGGYAEVVAAVESAGVDVIAARTKSGVLAFGSDSDVRAAFERFKISAFDLHSIQPHRMRYDSSERGLLREALSRAIAIEHALALTRRQRSDLLAPRDPDDPSWSALKRIVGRLAGSVPGHPELLWREGIGVRLDWANEQMWLLIEPRTVFEGTTADNRTIASDFGRERSVTRYNRQLNELVNFWASKLAKEGHELRALRITNGVDAVFQLGTATAFSRRIRA
jgi:hypothetical protein